jgi:hypothetical protein
MLYFIRAHLSLSQTGSVDDARSVLRSGDGSRSGQRSDSVSEANLDLMAGRYREVLATTAAWEDGGTGRPVFYMPVAWLRAAAYRGLARRTALVRRRRLRSASSRPV